MIVGDRMITKYLQGIWDAIEECAGVNICSNESCPIEEECWRLYDNIRDILKEEKEA